MILLTESRLVVVGGVGISIISVLFWLILSLYGSPVLTVKYDQWVSLAQPNENSKLEEDKNHLDTAQTLIGKRKYVETLLTASKIPARSHYYFEAQVLIERSSKRLLYYAEKYYEERGNWKKAFELAKLVVQNTPLNSSAHQNAQKAVDDWIPEWKQNYYLFQSAQAALEDETWQTAISDSFRMTTVYWRKKANSIIKQAQAEQSRAVVRFSPMYPIQPLTQPSAELPVQSPIYSQQGYIPSPVHERQLRTSQSNPSKPTQNSQLTTSDPSSMSEPMLNTPAVQEEPLKEKIPVLSE